MKLVGVISGVSDASKSTADHVLCISQIFEKKCEYNEAVQQLLAEFKEVCHSVRREVFCNLTQFGIHPYATRQANKNVSK
jgi:hypothetical protein